MAQRIASVISAENILPDQIWLETPTDAEVGKLIGGTFFAATIRNKNSIAIQ